MSAAEQRNYGLGMHATYPPRTERRAAPQRERAFG
jgi:hypothetical protein